MLELDLPRIVEANRLLAEASRRIEQDADYAGSLAVLASLGEPELADLCALHLFNENGMLEHVAVAPAGTPDGSAVHKWLREDLPGDAVYGLPAALRVGVPKVYGDGAAADTAPENGWATAVPIAAGVGSYMIVPLPTRSHGTGAVTLVLTNPERSFGAGSLPLAVNFAQRIALLLDKAHFAQESRRLQSELSNRVEERTAQLERTIDQLERSKATLQTLFRISEKLNSTLDIESLLDEIAQEAIKLVNVETGFAGLRAADGMRVQRYFHGGQAVPFNFTFAPGVGVPGWVLQTKLPYIANDAANDPHILHHLEMNRGSRSVICTPILDSTGDVLGYFDLHNKIDGTEFTEEDQEVLLALSSIAAIAVRHALAYEHSVEAEIELSYSNERLRALAARIEEIREEERTEIARELHDQLGQALTALKLDLARLTNRLVERDPSLAWDARTIGAQMDSMIKTVRRIATDLRPGILDNLGIAASIEWQAREFQRRTGINCTVSVPDFRLPISTTQRTALFRICQEALTNIARHAQAKNVHIELAPADTSVTLRVRDDGRGVRQADVMGARSLGVLGMRERAKLVGGTFAIEGEPGEGTTVTVTVRYAH